MRSVVSDVPKSMALVRGKPFLHYLFLHLEKSGIEKVVLSVGYKSEIIEQYFGQIYAGLSVEYAYEKEALGTGGGIRLAMEKCSGAHVLAMNGDSFFDYSLSHLFEKHLSGSADITIALRKVDDASRYGTVQLEGERIMAFREKSPEAKGPALINSGIYVIRKKTYMGLTEANKTFSIEQDFFSKYAGKLWMQGAPGADYFIDIGIPEDYARAQVEFENL